MKRIALLLAALALLLGVQAALAEGEMDPLDQYSDDGSVIVTDADALTLYSSGEDVRELQTKLTEIGYYDGAVSGNYGEATAAAVRAFQQDFGLAVTGDADAETRALIMETIYRPLHYGSSGEDVKRLQTRLSQLGYYGGKISGNYLPATSEAVKAFQVKMGLTATGDADEETQELLFSDSAVSRIDKAAATPAPAVKEEIVNADDPDAEPTVKYVKKLAKGSTGKQVKLLQERLTELGYYEGPISGNFLGHTRNAVKAFQAKNALEETGTVDEATWNAIFNDPYVVLPAGTPRPSATPEPVPFHIVVDVTNQVVTVYGRDERGDYTVVVRQMLCSTGTRKNPSDVGDWVLTGRKAKWCYFPTWGDYARYWTRINSSIAFHSVLYNNVDVMALRTNSYKMIGRRASHGCVRLLVHDAKWIYDNVGAGTVVTITEKLPEDPELHASLIKPELNKKTMLPVETPKPTAEPIYVSGAQPPLPLREMRTNDSGADVWWLQKKLTELGFYHGKCSGTYLGGTSAAVKAFQEHSGLRANGVATVETLQRLYAQELAAPVAVTAPPALTVTAPPLPTAQPASG